MTIKELKDNHEIISSSEIVTKHTKLSIEFAISVLKELDTVCFDTNPFDSYCHCNQRISEKIQELKEYL